MPRRSAWNAMPVTGSISRRSAPVAAIPELAELNIGHFLIGEAIFVGLEAGDPRRCAPLMDAARWRRM
jgi:pyridoxine 5'-phosphate synthase PdxJ